MKGFFRSYFEQQMDALGIPWSEIAYPTAHTIGETEGHDVEAILPGASADTVVVVHYDSTGKLQHETENPGADDDATGLASLLGRTARAGRRGARLRSRDPPVAGPNDERPRRIPHARGGQ